MDGGAEAAPSEYPAGMLRALPPDRAQPLVPGFIRADGGVRLVFGCTGRGTRALVAAEHAGYRARFPAPHGGPCEAVLINTGGGMTGGDRLRLSVTAQAGADAVVTTQASEKIYRAQAEPTRIEASLTLDAGAHIAWLPQETILFDEARLDRRLDVAMTADAALLLCESVVFGRTAMGETVRAGSFRDRWRIRRGGRLVFAEDVRIEGRIADQLARPALGGGAAALATLVWIAPQATEALDAVRAALDDAPVEAGATVLDGMLIARLAARDGFALRAGLTRLLAVAHRGPLPRAWLT